MKPGSPPTNWRYVWLLTAGAIALFFTVRALPTGTNLNHMDFRTSGKNVIEFCDPTNPQFIPVVNVRSPVAMTISIGDYTGTNEGGAARPRDASSGIPVSGVVRLVTASGKPIGPVDLAVVHTQKMHLLIVDPTLTDYQHIHPVPTRTPGEWTFSFTPRSSGVYRIFADFTPVATGRGLYSFADLQVAGTVDEALARSATSDSSEIRQGFRPADQDGYRFTLATPITPIRAGQQTDLHFLVQKIGGGAVPMQLVMGAFAHLVAFDEKREGFAHLHPTQTDPSIAPDSINPKLDFKVTIPNPGRYVIWAQTIIGGKDEFVPFWFTVAP